MILGISGVLNVCQTFYVIHRDPNDQIGNYDTGVLGMRLFFKFHECREICTALNISKISIEQELTSMEKQLTDESYVDILERKKQNKRWVLENHTVQWVKEKKFNAINLP